MLIKELKIEGFRGIKKMGEPLKLKKFNLILGRNNACKSTLLQALCLFPSPYETTVDGNTPRIFQLVSQTSQNDLTPFLYRYAGKADIEYDSRIGKIKFGIDKSIHLYIERQLSWVEYGSNIVYSDEIQKMLAKKSSEELNSISIMLTDFSDQYIEKLWNIIEKEDAHISVPVDFINRCIDEKFTEITLRHHDLYMRKELDGKPFYVKFSDLGEGVKKFARILLVLSSIKPELVLWDDFDSHMHPSMMKIAMEYLSRSTWQTVIATHSIDALSQIPDLDTKDSQIILVKKGSQDELIHKIFTVDEIDTLIEGGQDPRKLVDELGL